MSVAMRHPDLPGVVQSVSDEAFEHWSRAGWVDASVPEPEPETPEKSQPKSKTGKQEAS